jgi:hypothetical protein
MTKRILTLTFALAVLAGIVGCGEKTVPATEIKAPPPPGGSQTPPPPTE